MIDAMKQHRHNQSGFVSIFTALIIMSILTLITIGFTYSTRQAARRTLDDQLNTQAYYAAESGINAALADLDNPAFSESSCSNGDVDASLGADYTCVLVDQTPEKLTYSSVPVAGAGAPIIANVELDTDASRMPILFDSSDNPSASEPTSGFSGTTPEFPGIAGWGSDIGVLRLDIVPAENLTRAALINDTYTVFLYPSSSGSNAATITSGQGGAGETVLVSCNAASGLRCNTELTLAGSGAGRRHYRVRLQSIYNPVQASIAFEDALGNVLEIENGQAVIDATGRANDVYKRIQARVPLSGIGGYRDGSSGNSAISASVSICKRYEAVPGATTVNDPDSLGVSLSLYCGYD